MECSLEELSKLELDEVQRDEIEHEVSSAISSCIHQIAKLQEIVKGKLKILILVKLCLLKL